MTPQTAAQTASTPLDSPRPPGRVLRVKTGYNPNSSSVGTDIPTFLAAAAGAGALASVVLNLLSATATRIRRRRETPDADRRAPEAPGDVPPRS